MKGVLVSYLFMLFERGRLRLHVLSCFFREREISWEVISI